MAGVLPTTWNFLRNVRGRPEDEVTATREQSRAAGPIQARFASVIAEVRAEAVQEKSLPRETIDRRPVTERIERHFAEILSLDQPVQLRRIAPLFEPPAPQRRTSKVPSCNALLANAISLTRSAAGNVHQIKAYRRLSRDSMVLSRLRMPAWRP